MKYAKPPLTFEDQVDLLLSRGLLADRTKLLNRLSGVNYYRLSAYLYPFRNLGADTFKPNTSFDQVWHRYVFDRQLRLLVIDAIERVEVSVRTRLVNAFTLKHGAFGHLHKENFTEISAKDYGQLIQNIGQQEQSSKEIFVKHYHDRYSKKDGMPLWMSCELMSFGNMFTFFRHIDNYMKRDIAQVYGLSASVLESWLLTLNYIRNLCAHHARLWNRQLACKSLIPDKKNVPDFHDPIHVSADYIFGVLTLLRYMLKQIAPQSHWQERLEALLNKYPDVPLDQMGFPENWQSCPVWSDKI
ncbi:Abi family protein [Candidatus Margulisiibacteriota bacterium]